MATESVSGPKIDSTVARGASRMGLATLMSRVLGLVREQVFAYLFGASNAMDAFNIAFRIPNLLRDLFAEGAMSAAFVPNFTRALVTSKKTAFELLTGVLAFLILSVGLIAAFGMVFSRQLVGFYASSYHAVPGKFELAASLTRVMFPFFPLVAMAAVLMGALNALGFFFLPAFAPVMFNVASILACVILCPLLARFTSLDPIFGMAIGVVIGGFLQFYVQWVQIRREGLVLREHSQAFFHPFRVSGVKHVLWLIIPGTIGLAATQLNILVNSIYATSAGPGAVSWLNYAFRLMQFPIGIFGVSLAAATLPQVSRRLAQNDRAGAGAEVGNALRMTFAVNGPAAAGLMAIGLPIVQLLFQHGRFGRADAQQTAAAVFWYAAGLPGYSAVKVLVPVFYALGTTRIPVVASFVMVGLNALLNYVFQNVLHYPFWCLAAATSTTATLNALVLSAYLWRRLPGSINGGVAKSLLAQSAVSTAIGFAAIGAIRLIAPAEQLAQNIMGSRSGQFVFWATEVAVAMIVAFLLWWGLGELFKIPENQRARKFFVNFLEKRLRRTG
ncbi:MAG: murein biosynthesis integral membrane protein MurJ [Deltaproteobacteria bacterium]|nr:murein biosynthesis integral membrane protein MurJ [Deltaproteobacteria bacterium]